MKVVVTGASGFVGSRLVAELVGGGYKVAALGRKHYDSLSAFRKSLLRGSTYIEGDLDQVEQIEDKLRYEGFYGDSLRTVFHLAWSGDGRLSDLDVSAQTKNITRTTATYEMASRLGATRFLFCGSMEEEFAELYTRMDHTREQKFNRHVVYALAKMSARQALKWCWRSEFSDVVFATNSHVIGPGDDKDSFLQVALSKILAGKDIDMSSGEQRFDVIDVEDCARAYLAIAERGLSGRTYWVGSGRPRRLRDYVEEMVSLFPPVNIHYGSMPFNDVILELEVFNIYRTVTDTGFKPLISFEDSVRKLASFMAAEI
jgi:nucleoside-diphosphate-sugar epimerase